jgi:hypothetical protein
MWGANFPVFLGGVRKMLLFIKHFGPLDLLDLFPGNFPYTPLVRNLWEKRSKRSKVQEKLQ